MAKPIENNENYVNFINEYKNLRELWDTSCEQYNNKNLRKKAFKKLKKEYNKIDENATVDTVKSRIKNMRTAYQRELKKKIQSEKSGSCVHKIHQPKLWYFDAFDFLREFVMPDPEISTVISSDDECASRSPMPSREKQRSSQIFEKDEHIENFSQKENLSQKENMSQKEDRDDADIYADAWACSYRKLSLQQKLFAKKACDEIFVLGQLEKLTLNSMQTQTPTYPSQHTVYRPTPQTIAVSDISNSGSTFHSTPIQFNQSTSTKVNHVEDADGANGRQQSSFHDLHADADDIDIKPTFINIDCTNQHTAVVTKHKSGSSNKRQHATCDCEIQCLEDALKHLRLLEEYAMLQDNFRVISLLTQIEEILQKRSKKK